MKRQVFLNGFIPFLSGFHLVFPTSSGMWRSQEALKNHDSWMEDVSNTLQQMQEKEENLTEDGQGVARGVVGHGDGDDGGGERARATSGE